MTRPKGAKGHARIEFNARLSMSDVPASIATTTSVASATFAWIAQANEVAALIASIVAIIAGCYAIAHYRKRKP